MDKSEVNVSEGCQKIRESLYYHPRKQLSMDALVAAAMLCEFGKKEGGARDNVFKHIMLLKSSGLRSLPDALWDDRRDPNELDCKEQVRIHIGAYSARGYFVDHPHSFTGEYKLTDLGKRHCTYEIAEEFFYNPVSTDMVLKQMGLDRTELFVKYCDVVKSVNEDLTMFLGLDAEPLAKIKRKRDVQTHFSYSDGVR